MSRRARASVAAWVALLALGSTPAAASLWGYVDADGVAHLAARQIDARFAPVVAGPERSNAVPGKTDSTQGLLTWLEIAPEVRALRPLLREAARVHGVDVALLKAVIAVESGFNAQAVSPAGAVGLMQIMPATGERYAAADPQGRTQAERLRDPRHNIMTGARMLADLQRRLGRIDLVLAAWNAGEGAVRRAGRALPPIAETRAHVQFVLELYWSLLQREQAKRATRLRLASD